MGEFLCGLRAVTGAIAGLIWGSTIQALAANSPTRFIFVPPTPPSAFEAELMSDILQELCNDLVNGPDLPFSEAFNRVIEQCPPTLVKDGSQFRSDGTAHVHSNAALIA